MEKKLSENEFIIRCKKVNPQFKYDNIGFTKLHGGFVYPTCKKHGRFKFNAVGLSTKHVKCPECDREERFYSFVDKARSIHGDKYQYDLSSYKTNKLPINIICPEHGEFKQAPNAHLCGAGCPKCKNKNQTKLFEKLSETFKELDFDYEIGIKWLEGQRFDIYNKEFNFAVEYDGLQHYEPVEHFGGESYFKVTQERDTLKNTKCIVNKCKLFRVKFDYTDEDYQELVYNINNYINNKKFIPKLRQGSSITII